MYRVSSALAPLLYIPGLAYEAAVRSRNRLFEAGLLPRHRLPRPVLSVGNITLGGSGKTPMVVWIARTLASLGHTPAVLTRGYGRARSGETRVAAPGEAGIPEILGDEPALIRRLVPSAWLGISKYRLEAGERLLDRAGNLVFVLDDGFQHRGLHRDLDLVVVDASQPLHSNLVFPRGSLREPVPGLNRCDVIVINGPQGSPEVSAVAAEIRSLHLKAQVFHCDQHIQSLVPFPLWKGASPGEPEPAGSVSGEAAGFPGSAYLVGALGNPVRFQRDIQRLRIRGLGARFFADHHRLSRKDWVRCIEAARSKRADAIIITEKDAVKIGDPPDFPLLVAVQETEVQDTNAFVAVLKNCIEGIP